MLIVVRKFFSIMPPILLVIAILIVSGCGDTEKKHTSKKVAVFIGTSTNSGSEGVYTALFQPDDGSLSDLSLSAHVTNPTFLTFNRSSTALVVVSETSKGSVLGYQLVEDKLVSSGKQLSEGDGPCHVAVHPNGSWIIVSNYGSGTVSSYSLSEIGVPGKAASKIQFDGDHPHAHSATFDKTGNWVIVADLGSDKLMIYQFNASSGMMIPNDIPFVSSATGAGPRHAIFHPNGKYFYVINELNATVTYYSWVDIEGKLTSLATYDLMEPGYSGKYGSADIHISTDGKFLYASNRGDANSITVFSIDSKSGTLNLVEQVSCGGVHPRNFALDPSGKYLLVANRDTNEIVVFNRDINSGKLTETGIKMKISKPMCVVFQPESE